MRILVIDPGGTNGFCTATDWVPDNVGEWDKDQLYDTLERLGDFDLVICEDYIIRKPESNHNFNHNWAKGETLRLIGAIEHACWQHGVELIFQQASIKPAASKMTGGRVPYVKGKKGMHMYDALLHLMYYALKQKKIPIERLLPKKSSAVSVG